MDWGWTSLTSSPSPFPPTWQPQDHVAVEDFHGG